MKKKIIAFTLATMILLLAFLLGFVGINIVMKLVIGHGNEVIVPDIVGMNFDVARKKCKNLGLFVQEVERKNSDEIPKNKIISQIPHKLIRTKKNRTISVVVSNGPELVRVPFLDGLTYTQARLRLQNVGLLIDPKKEYRYSDDVEKNKIIYTSPLAEETVPKGGKVKVYISLGKLPNSSSKKDLYKELYNNE